MRNRYSSFIEANRELWARVQTGETGNGLLLVESQRHPIISHANAVFARIIKAAKSLDIGWIDTGEPEIQERMISYDATSKTIPLRRLTLFDWLTVALRIACSASKMLLTSDIQSFSLDGIRFGDILYDSYLAHFKCATIQRVNRGVLSILVILIINYYRFKRTIKDCGASAILVSHNVGLYSGVLMRAALGLGLSVYLRRSGPPEVVLDLRRSLSDVYVYSYRPRPIDMQLLSAIDSATLDREFRSVMEKRMRQHTDKDAEKAYASEKRVYYAKREFAERYEVSADKKFIFVMLHAFNDHPHSHFGKMLFRDYYDWFSQTLDFARKKSDVNWIFKEHPSAVFYPTDDISLPDHFTDCPNHIVFLDANSSFNSESLLYLADAVVTVLGTAGVEFASAGGIPSILAGDTFYSGFGFTIEPRTCAKYFQVLAKIENLDRLTKSQQGTARKVFLYIQRYSSVPFSWAPVMSYEEEKNSGLDSYYWGGISEYYTQKSDQLLVEFETYAKYISKADFSRLAQIRLEEGRHWILER